MPSKRERDIFFEALELPPLQRKAYLDRECGNDQNLRSSIEELFKNHMDDDFLEEVVGSMRPEESVEEKIGDTIDRYELLEVIGEGGCGVVFLAKQIGSKNLQVALKVMKQGFATKDAERRFKAEQEILETLKHSSIAKIYSSGTTKAGRPFFAMELVPGQKITDYANKYNLSLSDRINLFAKVCRAIQHAHQNEIIHRDIKPSNILVVVEDGLPLPKVIDFGIAKRMGDESASNNTGLTKTGQVLGTLAYMSPEQACGQEVDRRADVYSLGALLYELLVDQQPIYLEGMVYYDQINAILHLEPQNPSERLRECERDELERIARCRLCTAEGLLKAITSGLDNVVMRSLEKLREHRYETVADLEFKLLKCLGGQNSPTAPSTVPFESESPKRKLNDKRTNSETGIDPRDLVLHPFKFCFKHAINSLIASLVCGFVISLIIKVIFLGHYLGPMGLDLIVLGFFSLFMGSFLWGRHQDVKNWLANGNPSGTPDKTRSDIWIKKNAPQQPKPKILEAEFNATLRTLGCKFLAVGSIIPLCIFFWFCSKSPKPGTEHTNLLSISGICWSLRFLVADGHILLIKGKRRSHPFLVAALVLNAVILLPVLLMMSVIAIIKMFE